MTNAKLTLLLLLLQEVDGFHGLLVVLLDFVFLSALFVSLENAAAKEENERFLSISLLYLTINIFIFTNSVYYSI